MLSVFKSCLADQRNASSVIKGRESGGNDTRFILVSFASRNPGNLVGALKLGILQTQSPLKIPARSNLSL